MIEETVLKEEDVFTIKSITTKLGLPGVRDNDVSLVIATLRHKEKIEVVGEDLDGWNIYEVVK